MQDIAKEYKKEKNVDVVFICFSSTLARQIEADAPADLFIPPIKNGWITRPGKEH